MKPHYKLIPFNGEEKSLYFTVHFQILPKAKINITFNIKGDIDKIDFPKVSSKPQRIDRLWEQTCFEFFIGEQNKDNYYEVNLSSSKDWNVFVFDKYRVGKRDELKIENVDISILKTKKSLNLSTIIDFSDLIHSKKIVLGISAMIYDKSENGEYWAIKHSGEKPDFHSKANYIDFKIL
jgi:hypothetical protein